MKRTAVRVGQAGAAGVLIAVGIGIGAYNPWWVALFLSIPLIVAGFVIAPRTSRVSDLAAFENEMFENEMPAQLVPVRVEALTRSSLTDDDLQPTLVTATVSPPHDTAYQARWIASMSRGHFRSLTDNPETALSRDRLPTRHADRTPEFGAFPGRWAAIYPAITVLVALTVLFGVGDAWHVPLSGASTAAPPRADSGPTSKSVNLNARRDGMIRAIAERFGPAATNNLLDLRFSDGGSDYGTVLDPTNGDTTIVYINSGGNAFTTPSPRVQRKDSTFTAGDIADIDLTEITDKMAAQLDSAGTHRALGTLEIKRSGPGAPVILTGDFGSKTIDALPDGTVGGIFDPADFPVAFDKAREALALAGIAPSDRVLTYIEIRGIHRATPVVNPSEIQNSGGVVMAFRTGDRSGQIVVAPGALPEVTDKSWYPASQPFAFDDISPEVFESVRAQAMQRGALEPYEREAVDIWMSDSDIVDRGMTIKIAIAGVDAATGMYSSAGEFLASSTR